MLDSARDNLFDLDAISVESFRQGNDGTSSLKRLGHRVLPAFHRSYRDGRFPTRPTNKHGER
jgi:hypothetical protein